jgi:hypothetical protein
MNRNNYRPKLEPGDKEEHIDKLSFLNRTINVCIQVPDVIVAPFPSKSHKFRMFRKEC